MKKIFKAELRITYQAGGSIQDIIQVGEFKSLKSAYNAISKKSDEVEKNYSIYSNHDYIINNKRVYQDLENNICIE